MMELFGLPWPLAVASMATGAGLMLYGSYRLGTYQGRLAKAEREWDAMQQDRRLKKKCCGLWGGRGCPSCYDNDQGGP